jgi:beta-glucosidase/6-phospho-beta-glucosidase/beta-galactosidase
MTSMPTFNDPFMAGFESSSHRRKDGKRLDLIAATHHDQFALQDYRRCAALGLTTVRDALRWHLIETSPGVYDWSSWLPMLNAAREAGVRVIWDLFHYGSPDFHDIRAAAFADAFAEFSAAAARVFMDHTDVLPIWCPLNEISFIAWAVDTGYWPIPGASKDHSFKRQLVKIALAGAKAARTVDPRARLAWAEPLIHVAPRDHSKPEMRRAEAYRLAQFEAYDMLVGHVDPELGGDPEVIDVIGLNFYPHNQWYFSGPTIPMGHHEYRPLRDMLLEAHQRYGKPIFMAETGSENSGRPAWLHYVCDEVRAAKAAGAVFEGICLYPITAYYGWDNDRPADVGLFGFADLDGERATFTPLLAEIERQRAIGL